MSESMSFTKLTDIQNSSMNKSIQTIGTDIEQVVPRKKVHAATKLKIAVYDYVTRAPIDIDDNSDFVNILKEIYNIVRNYYRNFYGYYREESLHTTSDEEDRILKNTFHTQIQTEILTCEDVQALFSKYKDSIIKTFLIKQSLIWCINYHLYGEALPIRFGCIKDAKLFEWTNIYRNKLVANVFVCDKVILYPHDILFNVSDLYYIALEYPYTY